MATDNALLKTYARTGDPEAFRQLVERHAGMVYGTALRITASPHDAEDVTQDCFLQLARHAAKAIRTVPAWLHRAARNRALNLVRDEATRRRLEPMAASVPRVADPTWQEVAAQVDAALDALPRSLRAPVVAHYLEGRTQTELAEELGISQPTVSRRLERGLLALRERLAAGGLEVPAAALSGTLAEQAARTAPRSLVSALGKLGLSGAGVVGTAPGPGTFWVTAAKVAASVGGVVLAAVLAANMPRNEAEPVARAAAAPVAPLPAAAAAVPAAEPPAEPLPTGHVLLDEYWTTELTLNGVAVTEIDTRDTGDPTQAESGEFSVLLENEGGWPSVRFCGATMLRRFDMPPDRCEISLWYRTDALRVPWSIQIWQHWDEWVSPPRKVLEAWLDGGGPDGQMVPDDEWHEATGEMFATEDYADLPEDAILPTYVWISPTGDWDVAHRTYVDRIELKLRTEDAADERPIPEPVRRVRPRPGEQITGDGWIWWEGEDATEHTFPPNGIYRPCTAAQQELLSNGAWLQNHLAGGRTARWQVEVPEAGRYAFWLRGFWEDAHLHWRWNDGDWSDSAPDDVDNSDPVRVRQVWLIASWAKLAGVDLPAGTNVLELQIPETGQNSLGLDCWLLTRVPFTPHGAARPGETPARTE